MDEGLRNAEREAQLLKIITMLAELVAKSAERFAKLERRFTELEKLVEAIAAQNYKSDDEVAGPSRNPYPEQLD